MSKLTRIKREKNDSYTTINNTIIRDKRISLKAKGFFLTVMSLPPDWDFTVPGMAKILKEEETAIYSAISELCSFGYCEKQRLRDKKTKHFVGIEYSFYETSSDIKRKSETPVDIEVEPHPDFPDVAFPDVGEPDVENQGQIIKDINLVNNEINTQLKEEGGARAREVVPSDANFSGIPAIDFSGTQEDKLFYFEAIIHDLKDRLNSPKILPDAFDWKEAIRTAYENRHPPDYFIKTFDELKKEKRLLNKTWVIKAQMITRNIGRLSDLIESNSNLERQNGSSRQDSKQSNPEGNKRPTNYEISQSRDYSAFEGFDHIKAFAE